MFSPAGSTRANHLIPYLSVLFRSGLGSRPQGFVASSTPLSLSRLATFKIKDTED